MSTFVIMTNVGRNKEAAALANGTSLDITEIAWGDGDRIPAGGETTLLNEQGRKQVQGSGTLVEALNTAFFEVTLDANEGPFVIRESGLFDTDGDMIAIARYDPPVNKPLDTVTATIRIHVVFSDLENLILQVQSTDAYVPVERVLTAGAGLTGGGDLSQNRQFDVDFNVVAQKDTTSTQAFMGNLEVDGGVMTVDAQDGANAYFHLRDHNDITKAAFIWNGANGNVHIRRYNEVGSIEGELIFDGNGDLLLNGIVVATTPDISAAIDALVGDAPGLLDTLGEIADAVADDEDFASTMVAALAGKLGVGAKAADSNLLDGYDSLAYARKADPANQYFAGAIITDGGAIYVDAKAGANSAIWLRDEAGANHGLIYWDRGLDKLRLVHYDGLGAATGYVDIDGDDIAYSTHRVWHNGDAAKSLASNGYQKLPSGLIMQWGTGSVANNGTITFPIAFPTACLNIWATDSNVGADAANAQSVGVATITSTNFKASVYDLDGTASATANGVRWLAFGH